MYDNDDETQAQSLTGHKKEPSVKMLIEATHWEDRECRVTREPTETANANLTKRR